MAVLLAVPTAAAAGPWSQLPETVSRLQIASGDAKAQAVLAAAEASAVSEAAAGRLASASALVDAYLSLVTALPDGDIRLEALEHRVAATLIGWGDAHVGSNLQAASEAWALAARYDPSAEVTARLRDRLLPPTDPTPGQVWRSPVDGAELVWMPRFRFRMGCTVYDRECRPDELGRRWVVVDPLWMERAEVTNRRYGRCVAAGGCTPLPDTTVFRDPLSADEPVANLTWYQAQGFAVWAGRRLPSEAEWERAARGDRTDQRFPWGSYPETERGNFAGFGGADVYAEAAPAASFPATGWGQFDLAGNVQEWCLDQYVADLSSGPVDGRPVLEGGAGRVLRGGSWRLPIDRARVSARAAMAPNERADDIGFRCALDPGWDPSPTELAALATAAWPLDSEPPRDLTEAALDSQDRRYLLRRAVTWLVLEGREDRALAYAVELERQDGPDPTARDLLDRLEREMLADVEAGEMDALMPRLAHYRSVLGREPELVARLTRFDAEMAGALAKSGEALRRRGDLKGAESEFRAALRLAPEDARIRRLAAAVLPSPGAVRRWDGDGRDMVWVPPGSFTMGASPGDDEAASDERPPHRVHLDGFWLDRTEVTNADYRRCVDAGACTPPARRLRYDLPAYADHPVQYVDWYQARAYARWSGKRLPSESEWEYAARAGSTTRYPWGDGWREGRANIAGMRAADRWTSTSPVGSFPPNAWGMVDLVGNASEWVEDVYRPSYTGAPTDGSAYIQLTLGVEATERVIRGGSYRDRAVELRVSRREHRDPTTWSRATGFRCAADR